MPKKPTHLVFHQANLDRVRGVLQNMRELHLYDMECKKVDQSAEIDPNAKLSNVHEKCIIARVYGVSAPQEVPMAMAISDEVGPIDQWRTEVEQRVKAVATFGWSTPVIPVMLDNFITVNCVTALVGATGSGKSTALLVAMTHKDLRLVVRADLLWRARDSLRGDAFQWATAIVKAHLATFEMKCDAATIEALTRRVAYGECTLMLDAEHTVDYNSLEECRKWRELLASSARVDGGLLRGLVIASRWSLDLPDVKVCFIPSFDRASGEAFARHMIESWAEEFKVNTRSMRCILLCVVIAESSRFRRQ